MNYCNQELFNPFSGKITNCKNITKTYFCSYHQELHDQGKGICCFCGDECNPCSQSCGSCARTLTMNAFKKKLYKNL